MNKDEPTAHARLLFSTKMAKQALQTSKSQIKTSIYQRKGSMAPVIMLIVQAAMLARGCKVRLSRLLFYAKMAEKALQTHHVAQGASRQIAALNDMLPCVHAVQAAMLAQGPRSVSQGWCLTSRWTKMAEKALQTLNFPH